MTGGGGPAVVVVGSVNADLVVTVDRYPGPGETVPGRGGTVLPGGKGANQAVAAARLGATVALVGAVGDDAYAETATTCLRDAGVDLTALARRPGPTGLAVVTVAADGENTIVVVPGANATVSPADVAAHGDVIAAAAVVVVQGELPRETTEAAARATRSRLIVNLAPAGALDPAVLRRADPLVVNEHEAGYALALLDPTATAADGIALATALGDAGVPSVVVTLGGAGAVVFSGDTVDHLAAPAVPVRDTTGAGDAFVGALAARLAAGDDLPGAARFAVRVGAYSVQRPGAQPSYPGAADPLP
jgi:ribokinase